MLTGIFYHLLSFSERTRLRKRLLYYKTLDTSRYFYGDIFFSNARMAIFGSRNNQYVRFSRILNQRLITKQANKPNQTSTKQAIINPIGNLFINIQSSIKHQISFVFQPQFIKIQGIPYTDIDYS